MRINFSPPGGKRGGSTLDKPRRKLSCRRISREKAEKEKVVADQLFAYQPFRWLLLFLRFFFRTWIPEHFVVFLEIFVLSLSGASVA